MKIRGMAPFFIFSWISTIYNIYVLFENTHNMFHGAFLWSILVYKIPKILEKKTIDSDSLSLNLTIDFSNKNVPFAMSYLWEWLSKKSK